jgi:hypothetical protein
MEESKSFLVHYIAQKGILLVAAAARVSMKTLEVGQENLERDPSRVI